MKSEDIDAERKLILIKGGKGRRDRYTILSDIALDVLNEYIQKYKPQKWLLKSPLDRLFENKKGGGIKG